MFTMPLGNDILLTINTYRSRNNCNILVNGPSGSGKSRKVVLPYLVSTPRSHVVVDSNGYLAAESANIFSRSEYDGKMFNLKTPHMSSRYNPFVYIEDETDIYAMIECISSNSNEIVGLAHEVLTATKDILMQCATYTSSLSDASNRTLTTMLATMRDEEKIERIISQSSNLSTLDTKIRESAIEHAIGALNMFDDADLSNLTNTDEMDLRGLGENKTVLFIVPSNTQTNFLIPLLYTQVYRALRRHGHSYESGLLPVGVTCVLDEFTNIGYIPSLHTYLSNANNNLNYMLCVQSLDQIENRYGQQSEKIVNEFDICIHLTNKL